MNPWFQRRAVAEATWEPVEHLGNSIYKTNVGDLFFRSMWADTPAPSGPTFQRR